MHPIPCAHCGLNFMRKTFGNNDSKLCDNCLRKEEARNKQYEKKEKEEGSIRMILNCPQKFYSEIEETCSILGQSPETFLMNLFSDFVEARNAKIELNPQTKEKEEQSDENEEEDKKTKKGRPKK